MTCVLPHTEQANSFERREFSFETFGKHKLHRFAYE